MNTRHPRPRSEPACSGTGRGRGLGLGSAICLSISASPQRLSPAAPSPWRGELPPALDALCSGAKRAPGEPAALGAGRALGGAGALPEWERGR